ncbi:MAG TPA: MFS transporter [Candidatus Binatia bacterium]|nr:MFS transporter [Candidatus Binatia bacterium]
MKETPADSESAPAPGPSAGPDRSAGPPRDLYAGFRALRHRNFRLFFGGQLISLIGTWMQNVAQAWLVYRLTNSAVLLGLVGFASQIPVFPLAPIGGIVADRFPKRYVVVATQSSSMILAFLLAWLTLANRIRVWEIILLATLLGMVSAFDIPARQSFFAEMVGKGDLQSAIGLNSTIFNGARVIGPAIAGLLVARIGEGRCFLLNGVSFIAVIVALMAMRVDDRAGSTTGRAALQDALEGFRYALGSPTVLSLLLLIALVSVVGVPYSVLMPIFADRILHGGARALGLLMGATGVGAILGALTLTMWRGVRGLGRVVAVSAGGFGAALILFSFSRNFWLSLILLMPVGYSIMLQSAATNTLLQSMAPDHLRGRVMALYSMMFMGMVPFGSLGAGFTASRLGAPITVALGGAACMMGAFVFARRLPGMRHEALEMLRASGAITGEDAASD